ncbi:MAG TPA: hypothetical protein PKE51_05160 [Gemmatimonadaceae bacterium]|nr:hypothetical protein [Gemmatimonadaceae bacterium]
MLVVGRGESPDEGSRFYMVTGLRAVAGGGMVVVTDASKQYITFDSTGSEVSVLGRMGRGPGEFQHVELISSDSPDSLALFDAISRRLSIASPSDRPSRQLDVRASSVGRIQPVHLFEHGGLLARVDGPIPEATASGTVRHRARVIIVDSSLRLVSDLGTFESVEAVVRIDPEFGELWAEPPPYARRLHLHVVDSLVMVAEGGPFEYRLIDGAGALRSVVRIDLPRMLVTRRMREAVRAKVQRFMTDPYATREWTLLSSDDVFPDSLSGFDRSLVSRDGRLWLRRGADAAQESAEWLVLDPSGSVVARVEAPQSLELTDVDASWAVGIWTDDLGRQQLHRYPLQRAP